MKKIVAILLMIIIAATGIFAAADSAQLTMTSIVPGDFIFGVNNQPSAQYDHMPSFAETGYTKELYTHNSFAADKLTYYLNYVTNMYYAPGSVPTVRVVAGPFHHDVDPSLIVRYNVTVGNSATPVLVDQDGVLLDPGFTKLGAAGLRQEETKLVISILRDDINKATGGTYVATITFDISAT